MINPTAFAQQGGVNLSLSASNPGAHLSSLLINVICGIFSRTGLFFFFSLYEKPVQADTFLLNDFLNGV